MTEEFNMHFVATKAAAYEMAKGHEQYWVSNCGCREGVFNKSGTPCTRSRMDVCLFWAEYDSGSGSGKKTITWQEVEELFKLAEQAHLVTRPFRSSDDPAKIDGVCFCCDDCCGYFTEMDDEACDKGEMIETTVMEDCAQCGECEPVCFFGARRMNNGVLQVERSKCFGCGLCVAVCPTDCITMLKRD